MRADGRRHRASRAAWSREADAAAARRCAANAGQAQRDHRGDRPPRGAGRRAARSTACKALLPGPAKAERRWPIIIGAEIYDHLEKVVDRFEDVANRDQRPRHRARLYERATPTWTSSALAVPRSCLIVVALVFDFLNGLHDAANSIATIVSTRVLRPQYAVVVGGVLQLHRLPVLRPARGPDRRHRHRRRRRRRRRA